MLRKVSLLTLLALVLLATMAGAECYTYSDSAPEEYRFEQGGYACAGRGPGCSQCVDYYSNSYFQVCTYDWWWNAISCWSRGGPPPENQGF